MYCLEVLFRAFGMLTLSRELQHGLRDRPMEEGFRIVFVGKRVKTWENDFGRYTMVCDDSVVATGGAGSRLYENDIKTSSVC